MLINLLKYDWEYNMLFLRMVKNSPEKKLLPYAKVIVNPTAHAGATAKIWREIMRQLNNLGLDFEYELTEASGHAREIAQTAARRGYDLVVSVGGDGTLNEIVNGLYDREVYVLEKSSKTR